MAQQKFEINWVYLLIILVLGGVSVFLGVRTSRLSRKDVQNIATQAVLKNQLDTALFKAMTLEQQVKNLSKEADEANKDSKDAESKMNAYKKKYNDLKASIQPSPCDTYVVYTACEEQLKYHESYESILKMNIASQVRRGDTLQLQNDYLKNAGQICTKLVENQAKDLDSVRKKLRISKILNWSFGGIISGGILILLL